MKSGAISDIVEIALHYHRQMGWNVIPIIGAAKTPPKGFELKQYFENKMSEDQVIALWEKYPNAGIGVITGRISNVIVFDVDTKHGRSLGEFIIPPTAVSQTQHGGNHAFFKYPGFYVKGLNGKLYGEGVDVKGDHNYAILPPTKGKTGSYSWLNEPSSPGDLEDTPEWLVEALSQNTKQTLSTSLDSILKEVPEGGRNDAACVFIGTLLARSEPDTWEEAWFLIKEWNTNYCKPPEKEAVLRSKFESLAKKELTKRQGGVVAGTATGSHTSLQSVLTLTPPMSLKELYEKNLPPTDWDVEGLFEHGTPNMLSAAPNNFKTWLIDVLAISIASGEKLFGHFNTKQQGVLIVSEEDGEGITKNRFKMLLKKGKEDLPVYLHIQKGFKLTDELVDQLLAQAKELKVGFVMFDSLRAVHSADENNSKDMQQVMDFLMRFTREGITTLFTHHHRKKMKGYGAKQDDTGEESRGSTSINAAVHGHITCEHKVIDGEDKLIITQPKLKCAQKLKPFRVGMVFGADMDTARFEYEGEYADESTKQLVRNKVVSLLSSDKKWLNKRQLGELVNIGGGTTLNAALQELVESGLLVTKKRSDVEKLGLLHDSEGSHNSNYYQLEENDDY